MAPELTEDDIHQADLTAAAVEEIGTWLIGADILEKRVRELHRSELEGIAVAAVTGYILARNRLCDESKASENRSIMLAP